MQSLVAGQSFDLLVIPELASTGYSYTDPKELLPLSELPAEGIFTQWMLQLAAQRNAPVIGGFAERDRHDRLFNSAFIALPSGEWSVYRKTHLFYKEKLIFQPGDSGFAVTEWNGVRIGTMICYDWRFPESARTLALRGADLIASTPRQIWLQRCLGYATPHYAHLPVVTNAAGEKLSKQTRAPALRPDQAGRALASALTFLGQAVTPDLARGGVREIWDWASRHWSFAAIPPRAAAGRAAVADAC